MWLTFVVNHEKYHMPAGIGFDNARSRLLSVRRHRAPGAEGQSLKGSNGNGTNSAGGTEKGPDGHKCRSLPCQYGVDGTRSPGTEPWRHRRQEWRYQYEWQAGGPGDDR